MQMKRVYALLYVPIFAILLTGCGKEKGDTSTDESNSRIYFEEINSSDEIEAKISSSVSVSQFDGDVSESVPSESSSNVSNSGDSNYSLNFGEEQITLPCLVKDLDIIEIDESSMVSSIGYGVAYISYNGLPIGSIFIDEADSDKELNEQTVVGIEVTSLSSYEFANIKVDYKGITINDTKEKLEEILGEPDPEKSNDFRSSYLLEKDNKEKYVSFEWDPFDNDKIQAIGLYVK